METVAILIPAYKPDDKLIHLVIELRRLNNSVVVVNDGSGEGFTETFNIVSNYATVLTHNTNKGKGLALKTGLKWCSEQGYTAVVTADSDGQHSINDIMMIKNEVFLNNNILILGIRNMENMPPKSKVGNGLTKFIFGKMYGIYLSDTQTGLRGIPLNEYIGELLNIQGDRYEYEMNMLIHAGSLGFGIKEMPIQTIYFDKNAGSHFHPIRDGMKIWFVIFKNMPRFMISSLCSFAIDYVLFVLFQSFVFRNEIISTVIARLISATSNYTINKKIVFNQSGKYYNLINYFILANVILLINCILIYISVNVLKLNALLAKVIVEMLLYTMSFTIQNRWAHQKKTIKGEI